MHQQEILKNRQFSEAQRLHAKGDVLGALRIYEGLLKRDPRLTIARVYQALAFVQLGRPLEALQAANHAAEQLEGLSAGVAERSTLGIVYRRLGKPVEAEHQLRLALQQEPDNAAVRNNLALVLMQLGKYREADPLFAQAMDTLPEDAAPVLNRVRIALIERDFERAEALLQQARERQPGHVDVALMEAQIALAEADHERAFDALALTLKRQPAHQEAWSCLSSLDTAAIKLDVFEDILAALVRAKPNSGRLLAMAVGAARKHLAWAHLDALEALLNQALEAGQDAAIDTGSIFLLLSCNISQKAHRKAAQACWNAYLQRGAPAQPSRPQPRPLEGRKLRVGYLSSDLRGHAVGYLFAGVMQAHDHAQFEWIAYSNWPAEESEMRRRFRAAFDRFVNVADLDDAALAKRIRDDQIDVLVDLNGMTAANRLGVFTHAPAPVTVTWLGMPGTLGAGNLVDYVVLDPWVGHPGNLDGFDEQPVILAGSYQPNDHVRPDLSLGKTRADWKLPDDVAVFCSFNQTQKFSPDTVALWARILREVPDAVLWVMAGEKAIEERFLRIFQNAGVASERIVFAPRAAHDVHLARLRHADLMLDNWPYNAHTTCSDALRAGIPVLTLPGATFASRVAAGILETAGLEEWIATSPQDYVAKAVDYARSGRAGMDAIKQATGERYWASPMVDCAAFARRLESFYLAAFRRAQRGEKPMPCWVDWHGQVHEGLPPAETWRQTVLANRPDGRTVADIAPAASQAEAPPPPRALEALPSEPVAKAAVSASAWSIKHGTKDARLHNLTILKDQVLQLKKTPLLIDIGAAEFSWDPQRFDALVDAGLLECLGFEPDEAAFEALQKKQAPHRHYLKQAVGDGRPSNFHVCNGPHMNSLLPPNKAVLEDLMGYESCKVLHTVPVETVALDDVPEARGAAMIKLDTRGTELSILQHAQQVLESAVVIQFEAATLQTYEGAPSLFTIGVWLESQGFVMHSLAKIQKGRYVCPLAELAPQTPSQLLEVDPVFIPSPLRWVELSEERLLNLAYLLHALYHAHDAAMRVLWTLDQRDDGGRARAYASYLQQAGLDA